MHTITIKTNDANQRIDHFLRKVYPQFSLSMIYKLLRTKKIKVNNKKVNFDYHLNLNDQIQIYVSNLDNSNLNNDPLFLKASSNIDVVYEDDNILIVNKPVGLIVHEDDENKIDTLINRVKHYLYTKHIYDYQSENSFAPSLVNRIDRNTCGLVLIAKNFASLQTLNQLIKAHQIDKYYLCLVHGIMDKKADTLYAYLTRDLQKKIVKVTKKPISNESREIITEYQTINHDSKTSLLEVHLITGKTHQIRAHFNFVNHPLVGEKKYTSPTFKDQLKTQALCAYKIVFNFQKNLAIANNLQYLNGKKFTLDKNKI